MSIKLPCDKCIHNKVCTARGGSNQDGVCKYFDEEEPKGEEWLDNFIKNFNASKDFQITDIRDREKLLNDLRPKGEWIGNNFDEHVCNKCGHYALYEEESDGQYYEVQSNFCPECGADMRKGG